MVYAVASCQTTINYERGLNFVCSKFKICGSKVDGNFTPGEIHTCINLLLLRRSTKSCKAWTYYLGYRKTKCSMRTMNEINQL